ncbi:hypothetical protein [Myceligenerans cantabricum]
MTGSQGRRRAVRAGIVSAAVALAAALTGCGSDGKECTELYTTVVGGVDGVASVDADCREQLGGGWQRVDVHLATDSADEARTIGEAVLEAVAAEPGMDPQWSTPQRYYLQDGTEATIGLRDLGFNGVPTVSEARDHYGVTP